MLNIEEEQLSKRAISGKTIMAFLPTKFCLQSSFLHIDEANLTDVQKFQS